MYFELATMKFYVFANFLIFKTVKFLKLFITKYPRKQSVLHLF